MLPEFNMSLLSKSIEQNHRKSSVWLYPLKSQSLDPYGYTHIYGSVGSGNLIQKWKRSRCCTINGKHQNPFCKHEWLHMSSFSSFILNQITYDFGSQCALNCEKSTAMSAAGRFVKFLWKKRHLSHLNSFFLLLSGFFHWRYIYLFGFMFSIRRIVTRVCNNPRKSLKIPQNTRRSQ